MKRLILLVTASLLFAASVSAQHKSSSSHTGGGGSSSRPKPLPSLGGGTLAPPEPRSPKHSTPNFTITPEMAAQLDALGKGTPQPFKQPTPNLTITPDMVVPWQGPAKQYRLPKVPALIHPASPPAKKQFPVVTTPAPRTHKQPTADFSVTPEMRKQLDALSKSKQGALVPRTLPPAQPESLNPTAQAAGANTARDKCIELRKRDTSIRCVTKDFAYLRTDPNSFFVNTVHHYDPFRVLAVRHQPTKTGGDSCYYYGDSIGRVQLKHVWIDCRSLDNMAKHPDPPTAVAGQYHKAGNDPDAFTTRDYLDKRFSSNLLPETDEGSNGAKIAIPRKNQNTDRLVEIFANFDPKKANDPVTHGLYNSLGFIDTKAPGVQLKARYIADGGGVVVLDYIHPSKKKGETIGRWVYADRTKVRFVKPPE